MLVPCQEVFTSPHFEEPLRTRSCIFWRDVLIGMRKMNALGACIHQGLRAVEEFQIINHPQPSILCVSADREALEPWFYLALRPLWFLKISKHLLLHMPIECRPRNVQSFADFFHRGLAIIIERLGNGDLFLIEDFWTTSEAIPISELKVWIRKK